MFTNNNTKNKKSKRRLGSPSKLIASVGKFKIKVPAQILARIVAWVGVTLMVLMGLIVTLAIVLALWASPAELTTFITAVR